MILLLIRKDKVNSVDSTVGTKEVNLRVGPPSIDGGESNRKVSQINSIRLFFIKMFTQNIKQTKIIWKCLAGCAMTKYILGHRLLETSL